ncbi:MAG: pyridoxal phosphate-dependent aminotransferase [Solirubrobacteraceae bacterium]|nr:pyridoxal phosphate-dependent aminotransferase [Solirubrobacteraceae bacterium]
MPRAVADRLVPFRSTIFAEMTALAERTGAVNLGQGFPDEDGPAEIVRAAADALIAGPNQYAPGPGTPALRHAVAEHQRRFHGITLDPDHQVQVTVGATEGVAASILGLCDPGDEVIVLEPYYDSYAAVIAMAGAVRRPVTLRAPEFAVDLDALRDAVHASVDRRDRDGRGGARLLLLNSPHNPTGRVLTVAELDAIAELCVEHDLVAVCDEVYEHLAFARPHVPLATRPGMADRTVTVSSAGKAFALTGWKVGWVTGPEPLVSAVRAAKQFLTFSGHGPLQDAIAAALALPDAYFEGLRDRMVARRDRLVAGVRAAGLDALVPEGGYFVTVDVSGTSEPDAIAFCRALPARAGVVAVPTTVFYDDRVAGRSLVRLAYCKREDVLDDAIARLAAVGRW